MSSPNNAIAQGFPTNPESTSPTIKADTRLVGANKRVFYVNRKVAIMEEVHMKNSGRSLQEQMNQVQKILKINVQKLLIYKISSTSSSILVIGEKSF